MSSVDSDTWDIFVATNQDAACRQDRLHGKIKKIPTNIESDHYETATFGPCHYPK